jgi:hypothetical protein
MAGADGFPVPDLGGVGDALVRVKEAVAAFEPAAVTRMHAVEAVLGDRSGVGDSPGDSGELLHDQSPYCGPGQRPECAACTQRGRRLAGRRRAPDERTPRAACLAVGHCD